MREIRCTSCNTLNRVAIILSPVSHGAGSLAAGQCFLSQLAPRQLGLCINLAYGLRRFSWVPPYWRMFGSDHIARAQRNIPVPPARNPFLRAFRRTAHTKVSMRSSTSPRAWRLSRSIRPLALIILLSSKTQRTARSACRSSSMVGCHSRPTSRLVSMS